MSATENRSLSTGHDRQADSINRHGTFGDEQPQLSGLGKKPHDDPVAVTIQSTDAGCAVHVPLDEMPAESSVCLE
jgi:hypothetical protein